MKDTAMIESIIAIVEQLGHRRLGARISEVEIAGTKLLRCDVLHDPPWHTFVSMHTVYAITPCTEEQASAVNTPWTMPDEMRPPLPADEPHEIGDVF